MYKASIAYLFWLLPALLLGQPLDSLIAEALQINPGLQARQSAYQASLERAPQRSQLPALELGAGYFILPVETRLGPQRFRFSGTQMFPWPGTLPAREQVAMAEARTVFAGIGAAELQVAYELSVAYFQLYELEQVQRIQQQSLPLYEGLEQTALSQMETGKGSLSDVLRVQIKAKGIEQELARLDNRRQLPLAVIGQLLRRPPPVTIAVPDTLGFAALPLAQDSLLRIIVGNHPAIAQWQRQQEAAHARLKLNELEGKPTLGVALDYITVGPRSDAAPERNGRDILGPRVMASLPIYRKGYEAKAREERLRLESLAAEQDDTLLKLQAQLQRAYAEHEDAWLRLSLYQEQEALLRSTLDVLTSKYGTEGSRFDELLRVQEQLIDYQRLRLEAIVQSHIAKARVDALLYSF